MEAVVSAKVKNKNEHESSDESIGKTYVKPRYFIKTIFRELQHLLLMKSLRENESAQVVAWVLFLFYFQFFGGLWSIKFLFVAFGVIIS